MNRRDCIVAIASVIAALRPLAGFAQKTPRVGYLFSFPRVEGEHLWQACRAGLRGLGYVEGKNIAVEPRFADGDYKRLPGLVQELLALKVDVLVTAATPPSRAAMAATKTSRSCSSPSGSRSRSGWWSRLPVMYGYREFVDEGGLISLGPDRIDHYRRTALYVDRILKGAKPAELPVEQPVKFQLVINVKSANALGLKVPERVLLAADEVIK